MTSATRPLAYREFRRLWIASILSHLGTFLQVVAAAWLMLELTGSPLWVGLMVAAPTLPLLVVAMPAGAMADLVDRRRIMLLAHLLMAAAAGAIALLWYTGRLTPGLLLGLGLVIGVGQSFHLPSWHATVSDVVPSDVVASAVALNAAANNVARAVGPALGGLLVAGFGPGPAFLLNAVSYLPVVAVVALFPRQPLEGGESVGRSIAEGLRYARYTPAFRWLLLLASMFAVSSAVVQSVLPSFTAEALGGAALDYGLLLGTMGVGALVGAFTRGLATARFGGRFVPAAIVAFGVAGVALGLARTLAAAGVAMLVAGMLWVWILSTLNATAQLLSPAWVRGRIMSLYSVAFMGFVPLGAVAAGGIAEALGAAGAIVALSAGSLVIGVWAARLPLPVLGELRPPAPAEDWDPPPHPVAVDADRVMVITSWVIDSEDLPRYLAAMDALRRVRLRTGAFRWRLYRNVGDPHRMTEVFLLPSWEAHLRQHRRIDDEAAMIIRRARAFDRGDGPVTHHLAAVEVSGGRRPEWDELVAVHADMHRTDGSVPLAAEAAAEHAGERDDRMEGRACGSAS